MTKELRCQIYEQALPNKRNIWPCAQCWCFHCDCPDEFKTCRMPPIDYDDAWTGYEDEECDQDAVLADGSEEFPEPGFLSVARSDNMELYQEALPYFYGRSIFHLVVRDFDFITPANVLWDGNDGRTQMIRHLVLVFRGEGGWSNIVEWLCAVEECLSKDCVIKLKGNSYMLTQFSRCIRMVLRLKASGVDWDVLERTMLSVHTLMVEVGSRSHWASDSVNNRRNPLTDGMWLPLSGSPREDRYPEREFDYYEHVVKRI